MGKYILYIKSKKEEIGSSNDHILVSHICSQKQNMGTASAKMISRGVLCQAVTFALY